MKLELRVWDNGGHPKIIMEDPDVDSVDLREIYRFLKKKLKREKDALELGGEQK